MIVDDISEMKIIAAFDRGVPNKERIVIEVYSRVYTGRYGLLLALKADEGGGIPLQDNFVWFGNGLVLPGQLIFIYTGPGSPVKSTLPGSDRITYSLHWGRPKTVLDNPEVVPMLIRIDGVNVLPTETSLTFQTRKE